MNTHRITIRITFLPYPLRKFIKVFSSEFWHQFYFSGRGNVMIPLLLIVQIFEVSRLVFSILLHRFSRFEFVDAVIHKGGWIPLIFKIEFPPCRVWLDVASHFLGIPTRWCGVIVENDVQCAHYCIFCGDVEPIRFQLLTCFNHACVYKWPSSLSEPLSIKDIL